MRGSNSDAPTKKKTRFVARREFEHKAHGRGLALSAVSGRSHLAISVRQEAQSVAVRRLRTVL